MAGGGPGAPGTRGGGRPRAATMDPRSIADFEEITAISFVFARHPIYPEAIIHMNSIYADAFLDMVDLFTVTDPPSRVNVVANLVAIIKNKIRDESVVPNAVDTPDVMTINPL